jgi:hypothetical protein
MSQFYVGVTAGSLPPTVPTSFPTDSGTAIPAGNTLNILTNDTVSNFDNGITDTGSGNTVTIFNTNRQTGTVTTTDATVTTIITFAMDATPGTYYVYGNIQAYDLTTPSSAAYSFSGGYRSDGASGTELGTEFHDTFQDFILGTSDITLTTSGNNILVQVQGIIGLVINWNCLLEYRRVS